MLTILDRLRDYYQQHPQDAARLAPPASAGAVASAEAELGFALPALLRELYVSLGNGGFGPDVIGVEGGVPDSLGRHLPEVYRGFCEAGPEGPDDPCWPWPRHLVPIAEDACVGFFCLDCSRPEVPVVYAEGGLSPEAVSLEAWLEDWLETPM